MEENKKKVNEYIKIEIKDKNKYSQVNENGYRSKAKQDFIHLLYKDILKNFITESNDLQSNKNICENKSSSPKKKDESIKENFGDSFLKLYPNNDSLEKEKDKNNFQDNNKYKIFFTNGNSYSGEIKNDIIEGVGSYHWRHGIQYKGEFKENRIEGKGHLTWKDSSWYEGEFLNSLRHGKGTMVNQDFSLFYTGFWHMGHKNGNGLCHYGEEDYYDGMWVMGKKQGKGYRVYSNGSVYSGNWENDFRHGFGIMVWPNGDIYRGEWKFGHMQGYGEYVWNGYFNKTLSWPQENSYMGQWNQSLRHGTGLLKLNSIGGAKYFGMWNEDKKHGYGIFIGNDGSSVEMNPLFENDILVANKENNKPEENSAYEENLLFIKKPNKMLDTIKINHLKPEQWPILTKFMRHLLMPHEKIDNSIMVSEKCEKCNTEDNHSCKCLKDSFNNEEVHRSTSVENVIDCIIENRKKILEQEENFLRQSFTTHMPRLRKIYKIYTKVYCSNEKVSSQLCMSRMSLWQLWRDCGIHKKNISLIQIDNFVAASNMKFFRGRKHDPYESIEIWQFLIALLEVSWELYSKYENSGAPHRLADGFCKLLAFDIFPNAGNHSGKILEFGINFLPLVIYQLYQNIEEPHSVKKLLRRIFNTDSWIESCETSIPIPILEGKNAKTVGEQISFIPRTESVINLNTPSPKEFIKRRELSAFRELGTFQFLLVVSKICPSIEDKELNAIINIDYEFTFLEFYEILLEATVVLLKKRKIKEQERLSMIQKSKKESEIVETVSLASINTRVRSHTSMSTKKGEKVNNKKKKQK